MFVVGVEPTSRPRLGRRAIGFVPDPYPWEPRISQFRGAGAACCPKTLTAKTDLVNSSWAMRPDLPSVLETLRSHEADLRGMGVSHAAVFGSVARGDAVAGSDIDVMVELDDSHPMGIFEYARMKLYISGILDGPSDVVNRRTLKPLIRANILRDAVDAF